MAWIRLSDDYINDEKMLALSDGAFRLWHEGMAYCRRHHTDGLIPFTVLKSFTYFRKTRAKELESTLRDGLKPLWHVVPEMGYQVNNYLDWNLSKDEESSERTGAAARQRKFRERSSNAVTNALPDAVTNAFVLDRIGIGTEKTEERDTPTDDLAARAGRWREEIYPRLYAKHRHGARLRLVANSIEFHDAISLVSQWDDARLEQLATFVLTTNDPWISGTDRSFRIFALKASWADNQLATNGAGATEKIRGCRHTPPCVDAAAHTKRDLQERRAS